MQNLCFQKFLEEGTVCPHFQVSPRKAMQTVRFFNFIFGRFVPNIDRDSEYLTEGFTNVPKPSMKITHQHTQLTQDQFLPHPFQILLPESSFSSKQRNGVPYSGPKGVYGEHKYRSTHS